MPREEVNWFAERMETKLQKNDWKGHWSECEDGYLSRRLGEESTELRSAVKLLRNYQKASVKEDINWAIENVIREAADVANFAIMIADNARRLLNPPSKAPSDGD
jgi:hypothetical protein